MVTDLEKIINGLECIAQIPNAVSCGECAYFRPFDDDPERGWCDHVAIATDALDMMREQRKEIKSFRAAHIIQIHNSKRK